MCGLHMWVRRCYYAGPTLFGSISSEMPCESQDKMDRQRKVGGDPASNPASRATHPALTACSSNSEAEARSQIHPLYT